MKTNKRVEVPAKRNKGVDAPAFMISPEEEEIYARIFAEIFSAKSPNTAKGKGRLDRIAQKRKGKS